MKNGGLPPGWYRCWGYYGDWGLSCCMEHRQLARLREGKKLTWSLTTPLGLGQDKSTPSWHETHFPTPPIS